MRWDRFFEDLEDQLDSEWEAERAALDSEAERLRLSRIGLRERLVALSRESRELTMHLVDDTTVVGRVMRVGADWCGVGDGGSGSGAPIVVVPLWSVVAISAPLDAVLASVREADAGPALGQRMSFGFIMRDLARRRAPLIVQMLDRRSLAGTIDRAGVDHLDLALHESGSPRRAANVTGFRVVPFTAVSAVRLEAGVPLS